ncbi:MAG: C69 family dipeptidase [Thermoguttaceae bacterium]|jgi:dipeptidase|nr:C69 family dipeptidase [Thermoguttaceae bacterium]
MTKPLPAARLLLLAGVLVFPPQTLDACTTVLVGKGATADGSVLMATSCDGGIMGRVYVMPAKEYPPGSTVPMFFDFPAPATWEKHVEELSRGYTRVGNLPVERTYRAVLAAGHLADSITGGMNEHGLSMGIQYMPMKPELVSRRGVVSTCSNHWTSSLIANGLLQARTAREAIRLMGAMAEEHGFTYYWSLNAGCAIPVVDGKEAWIMEVFGPGKDWTPGSGRPGAVWCAQRVPDGEVTCNANRSRIGEVDIENTDAFLASANIFTLAEELGLWKRGERFIWREVYGTVGGRGNSLREWAALGRLAPSLRLEAAGDSKKDQYPFSVKPDGKVTVESLALLMRDCYEGTEFDLTGHPALNPDGKRSPLARPIGSRHLFDLLGIKPERCIATETSGYVYVSQVRDWLPPAVAGCMWFTLGPSPTSCFVPVYSGTTEITPSWSRLPDFTRIDRTQMQWKMQLVTALTEARYQEAVVDVRAVIEPAEARFRSVQPKLEAAAVELFRKSGAERAEQFVTAYTNTCLEQVDRAYGELADFLTLKYLYRYSNIAPPKLPAVAAPAVPAMPDD